MPPLHCPAVSPAQSRVPAAWEVLRMFLLTGWGWELTAGSRKFGGVLTYRPLLTPCQSGEVRRWSHPGRQSHLIQLFSGLENAHKSCEQVTCCLSPPILQHLPWQPRGEEWPCSVSSPEQWLSLFWVHSCPSTELGRPVGPLQRSRKRERKMKVRCGQGLKRSIWVMVAGDRT